MQPEIHKAAVDAIEPAGIITMMLCTAGVLAGAAGYKAGAGAYSSQAGSAVCAGVHQAHGWQDGVLQRPPGGSSPHCLPQR